MESLLDRITIRDDALGGKPILRNKRIAVDTILEFLGSGDTEEEILYQYPSLEKKDILACLQFAAFLMKRNFTIKNVA